VKSRPLTRLIEKSNPPASKKAGALHKNATTCTSSTNPAQPTLQPWNHTADTDTSRKTVSCENPFSHRIDSRGVQLPYITMLQMTVVRQWADRGSKRGEVDYMHAGSSFPDVASLKKESSTRQIYRTFCGQWCRAP